MVDLFEEVEEELRSDRYRALIRRVLPWVTGAFALVLAGYLGYWAWTAYQDRNLAAASSAYQKGVDAIGQGERVDAERAFETAAKTGAPAFKTLALIQQGDLKVGTNQPDAAAKLYDEAAAAAPNIIFGDLARLKAAQALLDTAPLPQLQTRLAPLTDPKRPFAVYAKEALAMAKLMAGAPAKTAEARRDFQVLSLSLTAPEDMRERAQMAIALIDAGEAPTAVAAVKSAATMPPSPLLSMAPLPSAAPAQDQPGQGAQSQGAGGQGAGNQGSPPSSPAGAAP